jgi:hypothetical protein
VLGGYQPRRAGCVDLVRHYLACRPRVEASGHPESSAISRCVMMLIVRANAP